MIENFFNPIAANAFEVASLGLSVAALVYAALALRAARQAILIAKESEMAALRLKAQDEFSAVERSFDKLQMACHQTRSQWERHVEKHYPAFGRKIGQPKGTRHIAELEKTGRGLLLELKNVTPIAATSDAIKLETFIKKAQAAAIQIERLAFDLEAPKSFGH
ncbi:MAG: hypothetical protein ACEQSU_02710 [Microgenomates group bacterium]